ncbi:MAG: PIN domain-containing protein [Deltaproteobacteria bacterium]|nr:PIN domain-containing protein [Deltaproteobacteria bacterium]
MKDRVLIDTSAWIDYFQDTLSCGSELMDEILSHRDVYVPKVVIAELIQGARSEKEIGVIKEFVEAFTIVEEGKETWYKAGKLSYDLKKKGKTINLTDCYIAVIAREHNCSILTLDKHFKEIQKHDGLRLIL